ncbi:hypothetical protein B0H17DRAFT_479065 [Mycena rosella]|uniref:Uncharacterized protein n=1 Tax=Mycena rosella TaxID=1033263 RepID=A0AAD7FSB5_MYCRO|nr:hypothetical protein B0H17DRAFT_479065 [Mycena rosella]
MLVQFASLLALAASASALALPALVQEGNSLGYLKCTSEGKVIGYVARGLNSLGEYKGVSPDDDTADVSHRMLVSLNQSTSEAQSLLVKNGPDNDYPFLGGIGGEDGSILGVNSGDYLHVGGTRSTAPGAIPSYCGNTYTDRTNELRKCASVIWTYNATTSAVTPQWINDDGTAITAYMGFVDEAFLLTGSMKAFEDTWDASVEWVTLTLDT